jgi:SAM-dependent methyltransferase
LKVYDPVIFDCLKPKVLVAGCGTGQHSIQTAKRFKDCHVLAIDLSTSSLAHAKRKSDEFGLRNIKYMQADILDLPKLSEQFDIIESFGVLHHMNDPIAGWQALIECLKPGGLMMISLYSELAREHIVKMREEVKIDNIAANKDEMRKFRQKVIDSESMHHKKILASPDFYSFGGLKDLIFHEQEHRFTIEQINNSLEKLNLKFCGYQAQEIIKKFVLEFPDEDDLYDIRKWHEFEIKYPDTFSNTDAFWCQKLTL